MSKKVMVPLSDVLKVLRKRIPLHSVKHRNMSLSYCCCDLAEAYQVGVEEAVIELVSRVQALAGEK